MQIEKILADKIADADPGDVIMIAPDEIDTKIKNISDSLGDILAFAVAIEKIKRNDVIVIEKMKSELKWAPGSMLIARKASKEELQKICK